MSDEHYKVDMPRGQNDTVKLPSLSIEFNKQKYKLKGNYFNIDTKSSECDINDFFKDHNHKFDLDFNDDDRDVKKFGYLLGHLNHPSIVFDKANFGVIRKEDNSLWCVFVPIYEQGKIHQETAKVTEHFEFKIDNKKNIAPLIFLSQLNPSTKKNGNWYSFLQWLPNWDPNGKEKDFGKSTIEYFEKIFEKTAASHQLFGSYGTSQLNYLPHIDFENTFPIYCFKHINNTAKLSSFLLGETDKNANFTVSFKSTSSNNSSIDLFSSQKTDLKLYSKDKWIYRGPQYSIFNSNELIDFFECIDKVENHEQLTGETFVFEIQLDGTPAKAFTFANGSIQFNARNKQSTDKKPKLIFKLSGSYVKETIGFNPEFVIANLPCTFSYSPLTDLAAQNNNAVFDTNSLKEDQLHRESNVVLSDFDIKDTTKDTTLNIRIKTQKDRNAIVEWAINGKPNNRALKPKALYFQAKPFSVAQIDLPDHDPEGGEKIAFWRSDDPEGTQWRIADSEMTVYLPPQAVGEEMERGKRFWPNGKPYIGESENKDKPVRYRFSPPTKLSVMPGTKVRRYNAVPNNLQLVLKESIVKEFDTEIVYPINTKFEVNSEGLPHIRISETAFFTGKPTENLPVYPAEKELRSFYQDVLADEIGEYTFRNNDKKIQIPEETEQNLSDFFKDSYKSTRLAHSALRANWASRIAQYHLYDPYRADGKLMLSQGLEFKIRDVSEGAPPLINPLPERVTYNEENWIKDIVHFLENNDFVKDPKEINRLGALRAGVMYTIEFESDLRGVLTNKSYESTEGIIEELSFTPLGANGYISASFNGGKKIFNARVHHGQISRLESITIGRLGVLWNKSRHVIVYERTTVPSEQFKDEQGYDSNTGEYSPESLLGWPIIRKTEEYIEPIEIKRNFDLETSKDKNACGFIESSEFISQKIYVNSAWGKNYQHGYAIPLWKADETNSVYAKPTLTLNAYAGEETTKQVLQEPEHLYFYTNTESATGKDSDQWKPQIEIDLPEGLCRLPVITGAHLKSNSQKIISSKSMPAPNTSVSSRRPRYDLAVCSAGPVNLQHKRGETQMLAAMYVISMARTGEFAAPKELDAAIEGIVEKSVTITDELDRLNQTQSEIKSFFEDLEKDILAGNLNLDCIKLKEDLNKRKNEILKKKKEDLTKQVEKINKIVSSNIKSYNNSAIAELLEIKIDYPSDYLSTYVSQLAKTARDELEKFKGKQHADLDHFIENLKQQVEYSLKPIVKFLESVEKTILAPVLKIEGILKNNYQIPIEIDENSGTDALKNQVDKLKNDFLARLGMQKGRNKLFDLLIGHLEKFVSAQIILLNGLIDSSESAEALKTNIPKLINAIEAVNTIIVRIENSLTQSLDSIKDKLKSPSDSSKKAIVKVNELIKIEGDNLEVLIEAIFEFFNEDLNQREQSLLKISATVDKEIEAYNQVIKNIVLNVVKDINFVEQALITEVITLEHDLIEFGDNSFAVVDAQLNKLINQLGDDCNNSKKQLEGFLNEVNKKLAESKGQLNTFVEEYIDKDTQKKLQELAKKYEAKAESGLKLVKALGDMPKLNSLDFNALAAEYVFGDFDKAISTSPYAVKLKEVGDALNGLGLTLPSSSILDQFLPSSLSGLNFRDVFNNMGGMDFKHLFKKFKLDNRLKSENIIVTHGLDKTSRQAWVKAEVKANLPEKQSLFEVSSIGVSTTNLKLNAISEQRVDLQGKLQSINNGKFISDFALDFSGNKLALFKEVTISFDNGKFDFDISPDKIELHPSIKFVSDIAKQIQGSLPPYIEMVKDDKGNTKGVRSSMNIEVANPPDFGAVKIGTLILYSGIQLEMTSKGQFQISTFLSVGKKETPIFLQIGELGGGMWLETTATQVGPKTIINASLGLAVGNTRRKNIGKVANGEYSIMLFAYANYQIENGRTASQFRAGISVYGTARVLSIANATIFMLLEAIHDSQNGSKGVGILDISISMGRFYKIKIKKQVEQVI